MEESVVKKIIDWVINAGIKLVIGFTILLISFWLIKKLTKAIKTKMQAKHSDETITKVIYRVLNFILKGFVLLIILAYVGVETAGIGSVIASCAVAIGLALQGSLSNIAGWFIIIIMRPFKLEDYILCQGVEGTVEDIKVFYTCLKTPDNKLIMVPNGSLANGNIINYSAKKTRRLDLEFDISYNNDTNYVIGVIEDVSRKYIDKLVERVENDIKIQGNE